MFSADLSWTAQAKVERVGQRKDRKAREVGSVRGSSPSLFSTSTALSAAPARSGAPSVMGSSASATTASSASVTGSSVSVIGSSVSVISASVSVSDVTTLSEHDRPHSQPGSTVLWPSAFDIPAGPCPRCSGCRGGSSRDVVLLSSASIAESHNDQNWPLPATTDLAIPSTPKSAPRASRSKTPTRVRHRPPPITLSSGSVGNLSITSPAASDGGLLSPAFSCSSLVLNEIHEMQKLDPTSFVTRTMTISAETPVPNTPSPRVAFFEASISGRSTESLPLPRTSTSSDPPQPTTEPHTPWQAPPEWNICASPSTSLFPSDPSPTPDHRNALVNPFTVDASACPSPSAHHLKFSGRQNKERTFWE